MQSPRVFIPQVIEKWDANNDRFVPVYDFASAAEYGMITTILDRNDNPLFLARLTSKIRTTLKDFNDDDYFVAVGDPSVVAICAGLILRRSNNLKLLKWDKRTGRYIVLQISV
jgi:hypothetical protein